MIQESKMTFNDRKSRERHPSSFKINSASVTQETDKVSLRGGPRAIISFEGIKLPTNRFTTG